MNSMEDSRNEEDVLIVSVKRRKKKKFNEIIGIKLPVEKKIIVFTVPSCNGGRKKDKEETKK